MGRKKRAKKLRVQEESCRGMQAHTHTIRPFVGTLGASERGRGTGGVLFVRARVCPVCSQKERGSCGGTAGRSRCNASRRSLSQAVAGKMSVRGNEREEEREEGMG